MLAVILGLSFGIVLASSAYDETGSAVFTAIELACIIGIVAIVFYRFKEWSGQARERQRQADMEKRRRIAKYGNPTPLPHLTKDPHHGIDIPENRAKLEAWNKVNFGRDGLKAVYPGPPDESYDARHLRHALFTPDILAKIPLESRFRIRNSKRYTDRQDKDICTVCGGVGGEYAMSYVSRIDARGAYQHNEVYWCNDCRKRFYKDSNGAWGKTVPKDINDKKYLITLWSFLQRIAYDLVDGVITQQIADAETKEVLRYIREVITNTEAEKNDIAKRHEQRTAKQEKVGDIAKDLLNKNK